MKEDENTPWAILPLPKGRLYKIKQRTTQHTKPETPAVLIPWMLSVCLSHHRCLLHSGHLSKHTHTKASNPTGRGTLPRGLALASPPHGCVGANESLPHSEPHSEPQHSHLYKEQSPHLPSSSAKSVSEPLVLWDPAPPSESIGQEAGRSVQESGPNFRSWRRMNQTVGPNADKGKQCACPSPFRPVTEQTQRNCPQPCKQHNCHQDITRPFYFSSINMFHKHLSLKAAPSPLLAKVPEDLSAGSDPLRSPWRSRPAFQTGVSAMAQNGHVAWVCL